ncbi:MAG: hypothetical protein LQ347_004497 [Umbilicaria vellea]|nr:MAG: hypothetical protein LQ347_004497 [Umbilicaria vellea]
MLVFGRLEASDYSDHSEAATSPLVESLRQRITCVEDPQFTTAYHQASLRSIPNALLVSLKDGSALQEVVVHAPLGHRSRRQEAKPEIMAKYQRHLGPHFAPARLDQLVRLGSEACRGELEAMDVDSYVDLYAKEKMECPAAIWACITPETESYKASTGQVGRTVILCPRNKIVNGYHIGFWDDTSRCELRPGQLILRKTMALPNTYISQFPELFTGRWG